MNILKIFFGKKEFREENFFAISLTVILLVFLNYDSILIREFLSSARSTIMLFLILLPFFIMFFFSITKYEMDDPRWKFWFLDFIVMIAMITDIIFVLEIGMYFFAEFVMVSSANPSIGDIIMIISAFTNLGQALVMATILRLMRPEQFEQFYISGNADKKILIICTIVILSVLVLGKYWINYYPIIAGSIALSFSTIIINVKNYFNEKTE